MAFGHNNIAVGDYSFVAGLGNTVYSFGAVVLGSYSAPDLFVDPKNPGCNDYIFQVGNGILNKSQNALWLTRSANLYIGGTFFPNQGVVCISDIRLKENIQPLKNVLSKISAIQPITYFFKDKNTYSTAHQIGFSAQEIQANFPELVNTNDDGYLAVNYPQMTAVAIQAVKEQQEIIARQNEKIILLQEYSNEQKLVNEKLHAENSDLEERVKQLEKIMVVK